MLNTRVPSPSSVRIPSLSVEPGVGSFPLAFLYAGIAAVALMAVPVVPGSDGPETALAGRYIEEPILGVVANYDPSWVADVMKWAVMVVAVPVLFWAASTSMLGLSRHVYVLATNRQIPSWLGKLGRRWTTPHVAIVIAAVIAFALVLPDDVLFLGGLYAFGATIAFTIAHVSVIRLRVTEPGRERPYRVPLNVRWRGASRSPPAWRSPWTAAARAICGCPSRRCRPAASKAGSASSTSRGPASSTPSPRKSSDAQARRCRNARS